jgi:hypothetical protein
MNGIQRQRKVKERIPKMQKEETMSKKSVSKKIFFVFK